MQSYPVPECYLSLRSGKAPMLMFHCYFELVLSSPGTYKINGLLESLPYKVPTVFANPPFAA